MKTAAARDDTVFVSDADRVLTVAETALMLGISEFTLLRKRQQPRGDGLPFVRLSANRIGYMLSDVRAFLAAHRVGSLDAA
jgi:hypothetical protein